MNQEQELANDIRTLLSKACDTYMVDGEQVGQCKVVKGMAVSDLVGSLRGSVRASQWVDNGQGNPKRWRISGSLHEFERRVEELGFYVQQGHNTRKGTPTTVVWKKEVKL